MRHIYLFAFATCIIIITGCLDIHGQELYSPKLQKQLKINVRKVRSTCVVLTEFDSIKQTYSGRFSGVVVSKDGIILTAAHAAHKGKIYKVKFPDGRTCSAIGVGEMPQIDGAMLQITETGNYPYARIDCLGGPDIDQPCFSLSYPYSFNPSKLILRYGKVNNLWADHTGKFSSSCLMEPGDSGGPLFNLNGEVIGIHSRVGLALDSNYEVPINQFIKHWEALKIKKKYDAFPISGISPLNSTGFNDKPLGSKNNDFIKLATRLRGFSVNLTSKIRGKEVNVLGTMIEYKGLIVSKNSMIGDSAKVLINGMQEDDCNVIFRDEGKDLVLLQQPSRLNKGVKLKLIDGNLVSTSSVGDFLFSPRSIDEYVNSVIGSGTFDLDPPNTYPAFIGADFQWVGDRVLLASVLPDYAANIAQLKDGDELESINGTIINSVAEAHRMLKEQKPGNEIVIVTIRAGVRKRAGIVLGKRPLPSRNAIVHVAERFLDGKSIRKDGFENIFVHDARLKPSDCGGPVFDMKGKFVGINMARYSRTSSIALNAVEVKRFIEGYLLSIKGKD